MYGIELAYSSENIITHNTITSPTSTFDYPTGIGLIESKNNLISENIISDSLEGIALQAGSDNNRISENILHDHQYGAICLSSSNNNTLIGNILSNSSCGVELNSVYNTTISYNRIENNNNGIQSYFSSRVTVSHNLIKENMNCDFFSESDDHDIIGDNTFTTINGCGILLYYASDTAFLRNNITEPTERLQIRPISMNVTIEGNRLGGISIENSYGIKIRDNLLQKDGIRISGTLLSQWNSHVIENNMLNEKQILFIVNNNDPLIIPEDAGQIIIVNSSNVTAQGYVINQADSGIQLAFSSNNIISGNTLSENAIGIYLYQSSNNIIFENTLLNNGFGLFSGDGSSSNLIYHNNFIDNTQANAVTVEINTWYQPAPSGGNYWSDFIDQDLNGDGIWDHGYHIGGNGMLPSQPNYDYRPYVNINGWL
jgi:parallel beta-helix repeat protein